jgi:hypothetical protein
MSTHVTIIDKSHALGVLLSHDVTNHSNLQQMDIELLKAHIDEPTPMSFWDVMNSLNCTEWLAAMCKEHDAILLNETYNLVLLPTGCTAISTRWVLCIKPNAAFKARWVMHGFLQHEGINYNKTYAPILCLENLQFILAYAILMGYKVHQMDIDNAFLQADLHEEVYVTQPEGFVNPK